MTKGELYNFLDRIKEPGYLKEPKQCYHSVNLVDLDNKSSADSFSNNTKQINSRVQSFVLTKSNGTIYENIRSRFSGNVCDTSPEKRTIIENSKKAQINFEEFKNILITDSNCNNLITSKKNFNFLIKVSELGIAENIKFLGDEDSLGPALSKLLEITIATLSKTDFLLQKKMESLLSLFHTNQFHCRSLFVETPVKTHH